MMRLDVLIFDSIPVEGNDTFQSEIEAHGGLRSASIRLDPPRVDFHWASDLMGCQIMSFVFKFGCPTIALLHFEFIIRFFLIPKMITLRKDCEWIWMMY